MVSPAILAKKNCNLLSLYHSITAAPQVSPAPKPAITHRSPLFNLPSRFISSSKMGSVPAVVFP